MEPVQVIEEENNVDSCLENDFIRVLVENGVGRRISNELFSVLRKHGVGQFPNDLRGAVGTVRELEIEERAGGTYYHFGLADRLRRELISFDLCSLDVVKLQFNIDGLPLHKSSRKAFWPVLCRALVKNVYTPVFPVGIWFGKGKPSNCNEYLQPLLDDLNVLSTLELKGLTVSVKVLCFTCDTPARAFVKCVKGHGGFSSCERCEVKGVTLDGSRKFVDCEVPLRSDRSFRQQDDPSHHKSFSPLCKLEIDMVRDFTLDYMHLVLLGVVRKLIGMWFPSLSNNKKHDLKHIHVIGNLALKALNRRAENCGRFFPSEFQRKPRAFTDLNYFKATEFRNIVCYTFPYIFENAFRDEKVYKHFLLLVVAIRLLLTPNLAPALVMYSRRLLIKFVKEGQLFYGTSFYVNNAHALIHLADDYDRFGQLDGVCSFPFESYMYRLKRLIKRGGTELAQVVKRVKERDNWVVKGRRESFGVKLSMPHDTGPVVDCSDSVKQYSQADCFGKRIRVNSNNDVVWTSEGYCCISNIVKEGDHVYVICRVFLDVVDVFTKPCKSTLIGIAKCRELECRYRKIHVRNVKKCVKVMGDSYLYVSLMMHENV